MAITWDVKITPIDVSRKETSVVGIRIDDTDPENILTETHTVASAILDTPEQKMAVMDNIWQQHLEYQTRLSAIDSFIGNLEEAAKENLEARE